MEGAVGSSEKHPGSFKYKEYERLIMVLHDNVAGNRRGPVLRLAGLRARGRPGRSVFWRRVQKHLGGSRGFCGALQSSEKHPGRFKYKENEEHVLSEIAVGQF